MGNQLIFWRICGSMFEFGLYFSSTRVSLTSEKLGLSHATSHFWKYVPPSVCLKSYFGWKLEEVEFLHQKHPFCFRQERRKLQEQRVKDMYQVLKAIVEASVQICQHRLLLQQSLLPNKLKIMSGLLYISYSHN